MQLNLPPVISFPSVSAVNMKLLLFAGATSEMVMQTASGSHSDKPRKNSNTKKKPKMLNLE